MQTQPPERTLVQQTVGVYPRGRQVHAEVSLQQENLLFLDMASELLLPELAELLGG